MGTKSKTISHCKVAIHIMTKERKTLKYSGDLGESVTAVLPRGSPQYAQKTSRVIFIFREFRYT